MHSSPLQCAQLTALAAVAAVAVAAGRVLRHPRLAPLRVAVWGAGALFLSWRFTSASFQRLVRASDILQSVHLAYRTVFMHERSYLPSALFCVVTAEWVHSMRLQQRQRNLLSKSDHNGELGYRMIRWHHAASAASMRLLKLAHAYKHLAAILNNMGMYNARGMKMHEDVKSRTQTSSHLCTGVAAGAQQAAQAAATAGLGDAHGMPALSTSCTSNMQLHHACRVWGYRAGRQPRCEAVHCSGL